MARYVHFVVDDMDGASHRDDGLADAIVAVRDELVACPELVTAEPAHSSGVMVATRRRDAA